MAKGTISKVSGTGHGFIHPTSATGATLVGQDLFFNMVSPASFRGGLRSPVRRGFSGRGVAIDVHALTPQRRPHGRCRCAQRDEVRALAEVML